MRNFAIGSLIVLVAAGCATHSGTRRGENDTDKQYGMFVDHESTGARGGVGNYVDRLSWGDMPKSEAKPVASAPAAPAVMDQATVAKVNKILEGINTNLYFPVGGSKLNAKQKAGMKSLADVLKNYQGSTIAITGYTDATGSPEKNKVLSEKRAQSVTDELVKHGIAKDHIVVKGAGQAADSEGKANANSRRVTLSVE